jgi:hypothetical protein
VVLMTIKLSLSCPEVNGFLARIEELQSEGALTNKQVHDEVAAFAEEHAGCPTCKALNAHVTEQTGVK